MGCRALARGVSSFKIACRCYDCNMDTGFSNEVLMHVGTHGRLLTMVGYACIPHLKVFAAALVDALLLRTPLNIVAYCIGGEKWSVALATVMFHCVKGLVDVDPAFPQHMCSSTWHRTCRGNCPLCTNGLRSAVVRNNAGVAFAVSQFSDMVLWHTVQQRGAR